MTHHILITKSLHYSSLNYILWNLKGWGSLVLHGVKLGPPWTQLEHEPWTSPIIYKYLDLDPTRAQVKIQAFNISSAIFYSNPGMGLVTLWPEQKPHCSHPRFLLLASSMDEPTLPNTRPTWLDQNQKWNFGWAKGKHKALGTNPTWLDPIFSHVANL